MKYYLDTCIWRDYFENRTDKFRPLGEWALRLINKIIDSGDVVLYSDTVLSELKAEYDENEIVLCLEPLDSKGLLFKVELSEQQVKEAARLTKQRNLSFGDSIHTILAKDNDAVLVTRDAHFLAVLDIISVKKPEELI